MLGQGYLLIPDPRSVTFGREVIVEYENNSAEVFDEYERMPGQFGFEDKRKVTREWPTYLAFQGDFVRRFSPARRGVTYKFGQLDASVDSANFLRYNLSLERYKRSSKNRRRRR